MHRSSMRHTTGLLIGHEKKVNFSGFSETDSWKFLGPTSPKNSQYKTANFLGIFWANFTRN